MKSKMLAEFKKLNHLLSESSWRNYQLFLEMVLRSSPSGTSLIGLQYLRTGDFPALLQWADDLANTEFSSPAEHRLNRQLASLVRKYPFPEGTVNTDPEGMAIERFLKSEHSCKRINQRFRAFSRVRCPVENELKMARDYISYVLGPLLKSEVWDECAFGAGASLGIHGNATNLARKLLSKSWTVTPGAYYYAQAALKDDMHILELVNSDMSTARHFSVDPDLFNRRFAEKARVVGHNKISFVPKDAMTHRAIATEPVLNGYLQKGVDQVMRKRLLRVGIDLRDQSRNQLWARIGSRIGDGDDGLATIDLSSASDSISIELCRNLLPPEWFEFLNSLRSHEFELMGRRQTYQKFTSMGNGFCFPLETLIFASLCHASRTAVRSTERFIVYGDDIVVSTSMFRPLTQLLRVCGFKVNPKKTFSRGPFRESCGADWYEGEDVRPIILDFAFDSFESIAKFCNGSRSKDSWNTILYEGTEFLRSLIPHRLFLCRPYKGNPETAFEVPWDVFMASPFSSYKRKTYSWSWAELVKAAVSDKQIRAHAGYHIALIAGALRGAVSSCPFSERFTARTNVRRQCNPGAMSTWVPSNPLSTGANWMPRCRSPRLFYTHSGLL